jgi:ParB-like chromosome segregation protein Spo0J
MCQTLGRRKAAWSYQDNTMTKINIKDVAEGRSDLFRVAPDQLHIKEDWNSRNDNDPENAAHIEGLATSIAELGVKQPLTIYQDAGIFYVSDGHCRLKAVRLAIERGAEIKTVPVQLEDRYSNEADRIFSQIVRNSGKPLAPFEMGRVFKRLVAFGWTIEEISKKSGINRGWVSELLELQASAAEVQEMVVTGKVSATLAIERLKTDGDRAGAVLTQAVATAEAAGKTRATKKHIIPYAGKPKTGRERLRELLASEIEWNATDGATYTCKMTVDQYAEFRSLIGF